jgi:hypothetical protein
MMMIFLYILSGTLCPSLSLAVPAGPTFVSNLGQTQGFFGGICA